MSKSSQRSYQDSWKKYIRGQLGDLCLKEIGRGRVKEFVQFLLECKYKRGKNERSLSQDSVRIILACLRTVFNEAVEDGHISVNPAAKMGKFYRSQTDALHEEINPFTEEESKQFLEAVLQYDPECFPGLLCLLHAGLRVGEMAALRWEDADLRSKQLTVRHSIQDNGELGKTKTRKIRKVAISEPLLQELHRLRRQGKSEFVFCNSAGNALDVDNFRKRFNSILEAGGIRKIRLHDLRHTFASLHLSRGESILWVSRQLGHASISMTCDIYGHLLPDSNMAAANKMPSIKRAGARNVIQMKN